MKSKLMTLNEHPTIILMKAQIKVLEYQINLLHAPTNGRRGEIYRKTLAYIALTQIGNDIEEEIK